MPDAPSTKPVPPRAWLPRLGVLGLFLGVVAVAFQELFARPANTGFGDYQFFHHSWELGRVALSRHAELPLWNPFQCGGIPEWGDPQSQLFHPLFFLTFLVGSTLALKTFIVAHALSGLLAMYAFARSEEKLGRAPAALAAIAWATSGFFAWHVGSGHGGFVAFYLAPLVLLGFRRSISELRWAALVATTFALALLAGGVYAFPYFALLLAFDAGVLWRRGAEPRRLASALGIAALLALLLSGFRLIPVLEHVVLYPRVRDHKDVVSLAELWNFLTHFDHASDLVQLPGHLYGRVEYGSYLGFGVLGLAALGIAVVTKRRPSLLLGAALFGSFCLGDFARLAPWSLLRRLPLFNSLQVPTRFLFAVTFFVALLAAHGLDWLLATAEGSARLELGLKRLGKARALLPWLIAAAASLPVLAEHRAILDGHWASPPIIVRAPKDFSLDGVPTSKQEAKFPPRAQAPNDNLGSGWCYTGMGYKPAPSLWSGPVPQTRVTPLGTLIGEGRTTSTVFAEVELPIGGRVVFNQTYSPGWSASVGEIAVDERRLALDLPPGRQRVVVRYQPRSFWPGVVTTGVGLAGVALLLFVRRRRVRIAGVLVGVGLTTLSYARALVPGPLDPPERPKPMLSATASDFAERALNDWYKPANAVDGRNESEWLAPPGRDAWLEVRLATAMPVRHLALTNAKNPPHGNYGADEVRIETSFGGALVDERRLRFAAPGTLHQGVLLSGRPIDQLRITIESWRGTGGGLAEVRVF
ncbi:MAG: hypothetical protein IPI67_25255 [Myxococcales bacterium]|nr:hypothetical protein [Myxococcales bacterium]